jgi:amino acid adenylation domain-containing protein
MIEDAGVKLLLTQTKLQHGLRAAQVMCLDKFWEAQGAESQENLAAEVTPENLAYAIYTSGSTGKPKGALIAHVGVVNYLDFLIKTYGLHSSDIVLQLASLSFDPSVREIIGPLVAGARVVVVSPDDARDPAALVSRIKKQCITCLLAVVPSMLRELVSAARDKDLTLDSVRVILVSGEVLSLSDCKKALEVFTDHVSLVNQYGPTEGTMVSSYYPITEAWTKQGATLIGRPISNCRIHILDEHLNPVPIGVPGELHIGGVGLARGYLNLPELTGAKFIRDPFRDEQGARLYKTGDLGRYLPDGNIEFLGRRDYQVKVRGFRVELGEIEAVLSQHPAAREAVVVARDDTPEERRLVAYLVVDREPAPAAAELRSYLIEKLPDYMVPSSFVMTDAIPRLPNGKVNRGALRAPDQSRPELERPFVSPRTPVEEVLAGTWAEVLHLEQVGVHDNFFELGGHSLLATRIMSRLRQAFQIDLPLRYIFEAPTVAGLAASILRDADDQLKVQRTAQLWLRLAHLSEDEVERMLAEEVPLREEGRPK